MCLAEPSLTLSYPPSPSLTPQVLEGSVAAQDGRLAPHDRILAINGADVRYARLDHASKLIQQCRHHVSLVLAKGTGGQSEVDGGTSSEYQHLFQRPDPALPVYHSRTKSAPERLVPRPRPYASPHHKDADKSLDDITNSLEDIVGSPSPTPSPPPASRWTRGTSPRLSTSLRTSWTPTRRSSARRAPSAGLWAPSTSPSRAAAGPWEAPWAPP